MKPAQNKDINQIAVEQPAAKPRHLRKLKTVNPITLVHLRDGEVVLYKRPRSSQWQVRFKLYDGKWRCMSTKHVCLEYATRAGCEAYDEARFKERHGIPQNTRAFENVAKLALADLKKDLEAGTGKAIYEDYTIVIEKYLIPYFGKTLMVGIDYAAVNAFEQWRNTKMKRVPKASTMLNHASAFNRVFEHAIARGWLSSNHPVPRLTTKGEKSVARPAFNRAEITQLLAYMETWATGGKKGKIHDMRELLRDYVEVLLYTGMRHGTEAMNIKWRHLEWYTDQATDLRYLRIWVSGKTGPRWLIAKHEVMPAIRRLHIRVSSLAKIPFDDLLEQKRDKWLFALPDGELPYSFIETFRRMIKASGLEKDTSGKLNRTLYSFRHTYATFALIEGKMDIHTLAKQMGTSVNMLEQHYSKLTPTLSAAKLG